MLPFQPIDSILDCCFKLVHTDIWGPYRVTTTYGYQYFLTILDDHSRAVWIYLMRKKSYVKKLVIESFCNRVENQFGTQVKCIRSHNR